jgi:DNA helicase-2/ATP-dependent DNA helicase PcrA
MNLNAEQQAAVLETARPVLVLAGPGTGKTAMMVQKYKHLVLDKGLDPDRILITTFTRKATEELEERISVELNEAGYYSKIEVQNFHSFCLKLLQEYRQESGFKQDPPILDGLQLRRFFLDNADAFTWNHVPYIRWVHTPMENLQRFMGGCLSAGLTPAQATEAAERAVANADSKKVKKTQEFLDYATNYGNALELLRKKGVMTYDLMLYDAVKLLDENEHVLAEVQDGHDYLLVDEVQDNNGLQARLVELIVGERGCVTVVGDEDQGIYKFRGAERGTLERFQDTFKPSRIDLFQNYRSSHNIVEASKALIEHNTERFKGKRLEAAGQNKDHSAQPTVKCFRTEEQEMLQVAAQIETEIKNGRSPKDIAVLFRSLNHKDRLLDELESKGIRYEITNVAELLRLREVRDLWSWLSTLNNPSLDNPAFERVLQSNEVGLPITELALVQKRYYRKVQDLRGARDSRNEAREANDGAAEAAANEEIQDLRRQTGDGHDIIQLLRDLDADYIHDEARHRLRWLRKTLEVLSEKVRGMPAFDAAHEVLGWLKPQRRHPPSDPRSTQVWANLGDFLQVIKDYEQTYPDAKGLRGFLDYIDYLDRQGAQFEEREPDATEDSVKILTAHRAKGLQWPVVFIPACNKDRFPGRNRGDWMAPILRPTADIREEHLEEERRVFFVAMTRAEQELHLSYSLTINGKEKARSQFLDEIIDAKLGIDEQLDYNELETSETDESRFEDEQYELIHAALVAPGEPENEDLAGRWADIQIAVASLWEQRYGRDKLIAAVPNAPNSPKPNDADGVAPSTERLKLSASALNTYTDCPRKFQFQYVLRIPQKMKGSAVAGSNVHRALEFFHKRHKSDWRTQSIDTLLGIYNEVVAEARFETEEEAKQWRERDERILRAYIESESSILGEPTHFEVPFRLVFEDLNAEFYGYIDRVDEHPDGTVEIIDYKTGSRKTANKIVGEDFQVPLYVAAFEDKGRQVKAGTLYWMREAGDGTGPIERMQMARNATGKPKGEFTDEAMTAFRERLGTAIEGIREGTFTEQPEDFACSFCDYRLLCPAMEQ